ncbi:MAG: tetratricopeptide repeat protein [bacterium]
MHTLPCPGAANTCKEWVAQVVSVQGDVQILRAGESEWAPLALNDTICLGDMIRVLERSRADVAARTGGTIRLDHMTTIIFSGLDQKKTFLINLMTGAAHFFSRFPHSLKVLTPFMNAAIEGTEFFMRVDQTQAAISVFDGQVMATNEAGGIMVEGGQSAAAQAGQPPIVRIVVRPLDAVQWALYYPPVLDYRPSDFPDKEESDWQASVRSSIDFYRKGDLARAFSSLEGVREGILDPRFFTYRSQLLLSVGRIDAARIDIERALKLDPFHPNAFALQAIIAVVQNEKDMALELSKKAIETDPKSPGAWIAHSYAQQAHFDLKGALASLQEAIRLDPENALAWARIAELWLSVGDLDRALQAAPAAVALNPHLTYPHTVLGFAYLSQIKIHDARHSFYRAIELDQADPIPRLGLGLARIWEGDLEEGRLEIEIAASLSPGNSLIRSYLGKAYFEERRDTLAMEQFDVAKKLDPLDPTPYFYDAIRKQTLNRPVEALIDLRESIRLNENRAVYRSRLLLDEDLAARSVSLARVYRDLGFHQLALVEGWKSLNEAPGNHSVHRFLSDLYASLPRHEIARVSELLKSQLLQPINIVPVQPQLAESNPFILEGAGPGDPSSYEFNHLFNRNRMAFQVSGISGGNDTFGDEMVHSAVLGRMSYSLGQFYYENDGFRENNDQRQVVYDVFTQMRLSPETGIQAEFRYTDKEKGDLPLRFHRDNFLPTLRQEEQIDSFRLGLHHAFPPHADLIASAIFRNADFYTLLFPGSDITTDEDGYIAEVQYVYNMERFHITCGTGYFDADRRDIEMMTPPPPFPPTPMISITESGIRHTNLHAYSEITYPRNITWTIGGSADFIHAVVDRDQFNPKFGVTWNPFPGTTLRAAAFRVLKKSLISDQTLEPTQVAGFNQFFDDTEGTESWRYGIGIDQGFSDAVYAGAEFSLREMEVPFEDIPSHEIRQTDWDEQLGRSYICWTPQDWLALSFEYQFERFERTLEAPGEEDITGCTTHRFPLTLSFFHPLGFSARLKGTYIDQRGEFRNSLGTFEPGNDRFPVVDASVKYRIPKRLGVIIFEVKNLFDEDLHYQDMDLPHPVIYPERIVWAKFTIAY